MNSRDAAQTYKQESVENAPPIKILRMLYAGALRFLDRAAACDPTDPTSEFVHWTYKVEAIVSELRMSLDADQAPEFVATMQDLYGFVDRKLHEALGERRVEPLAEARGVLAKLAEAWSEIEVDSLPGAA